MHSFPRILFVFIDGLGIGPADPQINPLFAGDYPSLQRLVREGSPIDATLGVDGLPQSASGQAALFTGLNVPQRIGGHQPGLPGPTIRALVEEHNLFRKLLAMGRTCTFANAYHLESLTEKQKARRRSVTTVATLQAFGAVRESELLVEGKAVYQDITRALLKKRGYTGPLRAPAQAARDLIGIADGHDFTLFEFFQTDLLAHKGTTEDIHRMLSELEAFMRVLLEEWRGGERLLLVTSDHGNIEDNRSTSHTRNPVPFFCQGLGAEACRIRVRDLTEVTPSVLSLFSPCRVAG